MDLAVSRAVVRHAERHTEEVGAMTQPTWTKHYRDRTVQVWPEPHRCRCGSMHVLFINRAGITRCIACEEKTEEVPS